MKSDSLDLHCTKSGHFSSAQNFHASNVKLLKIKTVVSEKFLDTPLLRSLVFSQQVLIAGRKPRLELFSLEEKRPPELPGGLFVFCIALGARRAVASRRDQAACSRGSFADGFLHTAWPSLHA
jgi:hypothetical protein